MATFNQPAWYQRRVLEEALEQLRQSGSTLNGVCRECGLQQLCGRGVACKADHDVEPIDVQVRQEA